MANSTSTVWHAFYALLRQYGITTVFGNPGSTEEPMLKNFPSDFDYVFALQEASVMGMADVYAQATRKPAIVSLHTAAGTGNGMGNLMTAYLNKTPLVVIAGQQTREMLIGDPFLTNREATTLPQPWVKWVYQPVRAVDVPRALVRAIATAIMPPAGPVFLSIPLDDWDVSYDMRQLPRPRSVSTRYGPDPDQLATLVKAIEASKKIGLVLGAEVDRSMAWDSAIAVAELLGAPVFQSSLCDRAVFPETHELFKGTLPTAKGPMDGLIARYGFDILLVVGAEVWRYYPWVPGSHKPDIQVVQITSDPHDAGAAVEGDSILSDVGLAMQQLRQQLSKSASLSKTTMQPLQRHRSQMHAVPRFPNALRAPNAPMTATQAFAAIAALRPENAILVHETPSNGADLVEAWKINRPNSYYTFASGGLGWGCPAAVGIALAQQVEKTDRPVVLAIGDGSFQYSVQSIYSAVQLRVKLIILVPANGEYAILKEFAELEATPNVPALDIPGLNACKNAIAYGCPSFHAEDEKQLQSLFKEALARDGPTLIQFAIDTTLKPLVRTAEDM